MKETHKLQCHFKGGVHLMKILKENLDPNK